MPTPIAAMGIQKGLDVAQDAVNTGMGLLLEGHNDRRQIKQQKKLQDLQLIGMKDMADYNQQLQLKTWEATNYKAQKDQLIKAGLNPGLLYGMSGGGGATTGGATGAGVSGGQAPTGGSEVMGILMQKQLMEAQTQNIKADTAKKEAETEKTKGVDTTKAQTEIQSITQGIENQKTQNALMQAQKLATEINAQNVETQTKLIEDQIMIMDRDVEIANATKEDKISQIKAEAANAIITGQAIKQGIELNKAQINKMTQDIIQRGQEINIEQFKAEIEANFKGIDRIAGNLIEQIFKKIDTATGKNNDQRPIKIK